MACYWELPLLSIVLAPVPMSNVAAKPAMMLRRSLDPSGGTLNQPACHV